MNQAKGSPSIQSQNTQWLGRTKELLLAALAFHFPSDIATFISAGSREFAVFFVLRVKLVAVHRLWKSACNQVEDLIARKHILPVNPKAYSHLFASTVRFTNL